ncbi:cytochrome c biogenesis protein CcsA [Silvanigrella aquatica]|uniref:Cytochrome c assembly protein domain-containing protein n=1 Tax=Silvanigrella aquatica TaxID=1915309 RepID=A0A1L4D1F0_9BACT|nr:cytochrome c biogenesis protein CcsA [Silvanigrella aquatica]APJ04035.1 hypothetical protein AXG55_08990 [Silvanigrella aquatica]
MPNLSFQENLIQNIFMLEAVSRIAMSTLYGFAVLSFGYTLSLRAREKKHFEMFHNLARILFGFATIFTIIYGTLEFILPLNSITTQVYTVICLVLALAVIVIDRGKEGLPSFSFLMGALIFLMVTITPFVDPKPLYRATSVDWLVYFHIGTAALGEAIFVASFCASLLYLRDYQNLKKRKWDKNSSHTSLSTLEKLIERSSLIGLTFITCSLLSGLALIFIGTFAVQVGFIKILWAFLVWGWYVMTIFGRSFWGWRGRKGAKLAIFGMILLLLGLFGTIWQYF